MLGRICVWSVVIGVVLVVFCAQSLIVVVVVVVKRGVGGGGGGHFVSMSVMVAAFCGSLTALFCSVCVCFCCLTSNGARRPVRDGDDGKGGQKSETSRQAPTRKTKAAVDRRQNNRMLRQCHSPSGIAQRPQHHAIAVPTAMQNRVTKTMSVAPPLGNN